MVLDIDDTLSSLAQKFVWSLQDCHLKTLVINKMRSITELQKDEERVVSQQRDQVNEVRRDRGLPSLEVVYEHLEDIIMNPYFR